MGGPSRPAGFAIAGGAFRPHSRDRTAVPRPHISSAAPASPCGRVGEVHRRPGRLALRRLLRAPATLAPAWVGRTRSWASASWKPEEREGPDGLIDEYALNFDVVAHEIGHALVLALSGPFVPGETTGEIEAFHEMSSDWVALIAALHFDSVVNELLDSTFGDLDSFNRLSRFAEVSSNSQIRLANNKRTLYDFEAGWKSEHDVAKPLIGAFFDTFIDIYHELLVEYGAIPPSLERLADAAERDRSLRTRMRRGFQLAYDRRPDLFRMALRGSRDIIARTLARFLYDLDSEKDVFQYFWTLLSNGTVHQCTFAESIFGDHFKRRGIGQTVLGPRIEKGSIRSHTRSTRLTIPRTVNETGVSERFY